MQYLVCYDIEDTKNRTKLSESLLDLGLIRIQKSVFYGKLIKPELKIVKSLFKKFCSKDDKAFISVSNLLLENSFGYQKEDFEFKEFIII